MLMIALIWWSAPYWPVRSICMNWDVNPSNRSVYFGRAAAASFVSENHDPEHPMIHVIDNHRAAENQPLLRSMFADRKRLFVDLLGWDIPVVDGQYEIDQFVNVHTVYLDRKSVVQG